MRNIVRDPILGNGLIFDLAIKEVGADFIAAAVNPPLFDRGPNRIQAISDSFVGGTYVIETPGLYPVLTIDLDGTADYINLGTGAWFDTIATTNAMTFEAVVLPDAVGSEMIMAGWVTGAGGAGGYPQLMINASGYPEFRPTQDTGETSVVIGSVDLTAGTVHHIVATFAESDNIARIRVDGGETDDANATIVCTNDVLLALGADSFYIGARDNNGGAIENFFDGHVYWARMWNRRLSQREQDLLFTRARYVLGL